MDLEEQILKAISEVHHVLFFEFSFEADQVCLISQKVYCNICNLENHYAASKKKGAIIKICAFCFSSC